MMTPEDLRAWRKAKGWTQREAADALGYSRRGYQDAEVNAHEASAISRGLADAVSLIERGGRPTVKSVANLTMGDLSDQENVKTCEHELRRATSDASLADWARRWGEAVMARLHDRAGRDEEDAEDLAKAEKEIDRVEALNATLSDATDTLIKVVDDEVTPQSEKLQRAIAAVENAR